MNTREVIKQRFGIIGNSAQINQALEIAIQVAPTEVSVLVLGENGTGKDVFARIIHQLSKRKHKTFIAINCGAIPEGTIDSELFGHERGSFTSAYESRKGYFEEANGGTIFLDEIAEMPLPTQSRLLRVLESGEFIRVGSSKIQKTDVRIVAATNKNLIDAIHQNKFREDLYFRLNTVTIQVPPLKDRKEDLEILFRYFASLFAEKYQRKPIRLTAPALDILHKYHWPGNIRELRNFVEKVSVLIQHDDLQEQEVLEHLPFLDTPYPVVSKSPISFNPFHSQNNEININNEFLIKALLEIKKEIHEVKDLLTDYISHPTWNLEQSPPISNANSAYFSSIPLIEEPLSIEKKEKDLIIKALNKFKNNRKKAAEELGISERTLYRKIKQFDIQL